MSFDTVSGQEHAKRLIRSALASNRLAHAYLFSGPDGIGKTRLAIETAKALLCGGAGERPCDECRDCHLVDCGSHPDLIIVQAIEGKRVIGIDQAREIGRTLSLMPVQSERRVVILREAERLPEPAANSLLKTLEEPPRFAVLILTTSRPRALLSTIRSRCQEVCFASLSAQQVFDILSKRPEFSEEEIRLASDLSGGSAGGALRLLEYGCLEVYGGVLQGALALPDGDAFMLSDSLLGWARTFSKKLEPQRERVRVILRLLAGAYRDVLFVQAGGTEDALFHARERGALGRLAARMRPARLFQALDAVWDASRRINANAAMSLVLDNLFARLGELQAGSEARSLGA